MQADCVQPRVLWFMSRLASVYEFLSTIFLNFITNSGLSQFFMSVFFFFDFVILFLLRSARNWFSLTFSLSGSCRGAVSRFMTNTVGITRRPRDCCWSSIRSGVSAHVYWWAARELDYSDFKLWNVAHPSCQPLGHLQMWCKISWIPQPNQVPFNCDGKRKQLASRP